MKEKIVGGWKGWGVWDTRSKNSHGSGVNFDDNDKSIVTVSFDMMINVINFYVNLF